jgi:hypothetical protein
MHTCREEYICGFQIFRPELQEKLVYFKEK